MADHSISLSSGPGQRRRITRYKMFGPVSLHVQGNTIRAHFLDLSTGGALAHSETPPSLGTYLEIQASGLAASGRVMWANGKRFGIRFNEPLSEAVMQMVIRNN